MSAIIVPLSADKFGAIALAGTAFDVVPCIAVGGHTTSPCRCSYSGGLDPHIHVVARPSTVSVTESDVMGSRSLNSAFSLRCPMVQRGYWHTGEVMHFFGRQHLTTVREGVRHCCSLRLKGYRRANVRSPLSGHDVTVSSYPHPLVHNFQPCLYRSVELDAFAVGGPTVRRALRETGCCSIYSAQSS